jgi:transposase
MSARSQRIEVITRGERRRRWSVEQKREIAAEPPERRRRIEVANRNRGALPAHLPRYEVLIDIENKQCPCCSGALH